MMLQPYRRLRRRFPRIRCGGEKGRFKILFIGDRPVDLPTGEAQLMDVSRGGTCIVTDLRLPVHLPTVLRLQFQLQGREFDVCARVVWGRREDHGRFRYGLRFWGSSPQCLDAFHRNLDAIRIDLLA
ncbi:MAG: PilZ domain-containing protein [Thermaerobacter sp.]|nr:hypothetical protein [Bacillota bacterium]REJ37667.1 MAG: hypothetical protein DIU84_03960 [Bacillota bacterium]